MKFVLAYMSEYKKESIMAPLFKMLEAVFELLVPFVVAAIIDIGIAEGDSGYIIKMAILMLVLAIIGMISALTAQYFAARAATGVAYAVRKDLNDTILGMSKKRYRDIGKSTLLTRMTSDVNQMQNAVNMFLRLFLRSPFIVIGAFVMSLVIDAKMSLIIGGVILVLAIVIFIVMRITLPRIGTTMGKIDGLSRRIRNDYAGAKVIRGFGIQDEEDDKFKGQVEEIYKRQIGVGRFSNLLNPLTFVFVNMGIILVLYFGGGKVEIGTLTTGAVVALLNYMSQILIELVKLADLIVILMKGIPSAKRLRDIIDVSDKGDTYNEAPIVTSARGIVRENLKNISPGEKIGIIGPTGSGKSLLLSVYMDEKKDKSKVGYVPQEDNFFTGSIGDNIVLRNYDGEDVEDALNKSCFKEVVDTKGGLDEKIIKNAMNLSVGQKKRLALARALNKKPDVMLMDDVTNPLDMITERKVIDNMLSSDMAVIIASQKPSAVMRADKILVIDKGSLVDSGSHEELLKRCELYSKMYYAQFSYDANGHASEGRRHA